ncbi:MAG: hypothetical protein QXI11_05805 [Thermoproteota archaeon]
MISYLLLLMFMYGWDVRLSLTLRDDEVVELIRRRRWPKNLSKT